ncbi:unnamed protein product [Lecanosticta acicola]|uniref:Unnamed protein product n=1 Tax=Lecanosticta acicola TaxID=111012 RepID=A0AAI8W1X2_9PEZI|nr:unnamed protein product [Lecanosticta acicola]
MGSAAPNDQGAYDVLIIGGGFSGIWQLYLLRKSGFKVRLLEAGTALGGIWHWNAYPGARVDTSVPTYQLTAEDSWKDWHWKEKFPSRAELVAYFEHLDNIWGLSKDVSFESRLTSMQWDAENARWKCMVNNGESQWSASFVVLCTGFASKRYVPPFKNIDRFQGEIHHTAAWPREGTALKDRRVAVIGTGASGVQAIQEIAKEASHLTVFQRTPNTALPMRNSDVDNAAVKLYYPATERVVKSSFGAFDYDFAKVDGDPMNLPKAERMRQYEQLYNAGGLKLWLGTYIAMLIDEDLNEEVYQFWRSKTIARVADPVRAEILAPERKVHPFGTKRVSLEQNFFEVFNQENVDLVDLHSTPIEEFLPNAIRTSDGYVHEVELIVLATGFVSYTGGITDIDIRNAHGQSIKDKWTQETHTTLGMATSGFPNLFFQYGPQAPTAFSTGPISAETQGAWIEQLLLHARDNGFKTVECTPEAEKEWRKHVHDVANQTLFPKAKSWYMGANIAGREPEVLNYMGGLPVYRQQIWDCAKSGYVGFVLAE